ncbi:MAG TPA: S41 family peptidase [Candidatus Saccharimonadales bacterium]|nr:S41 family peptidase [Candidatus Saccharimonadales bacterium]
MNRRILYGFLIAALGINLFFGAQIYFYSAHASQKDDPYENYRLLADVLEKVRQEYVDGDKLTYQDLIHGALKGMLNSLDPHSEFMDPEKFDELKKDTEGEFGGVGIMVEMNKDKVLTVVSPMEDSPGIRAGIMPQDQILKIDGKSTSRLEFEDAVKELRGAPGTFISITVRRPSTGQIKDYKLERAIIKVDTIVDINGKSDFPLGQNGIGYVRIKQFGEKTSDDLDKALKRLTSEGVKALIIDLRDNPGGLLEQAGQVCEKFLPRNQLIVTTEGRGPTPVSEYRASGRGKRIDLPMVVLVNGNSASAAEIVAGCLQDLQPITHAIVVGEQTFGKGSVQSILPLADGSALRLTTAKYYTPSHKVIHEHGITPDIVVAMTPAEELDLETKDIPGALDVLSPKDRERVEALHDRQFDRAIDLLRGVLLYAQRSPGPSRVAAAVPATQ